MPYLRDTVDLLLVTASIYIWEIFLKKIASVTNSSACC